MLDETPTPTIGIVPHVSHPFKDTRGRFRTKSLFVEWETPSYPAHYTLGPEDRGTYLSLRRLFLETRDPTEYTFASKYLAGWDHHQAMLSACAWYRDLFDDWRIELEVILRSEGVAKMRMLADDHRVPYATRCVAAKYLCELGWKTDKAPKRGRPSKHEVQGQLVKEARAAAALADDAARLGIEH